jgi:hypothetical protein
MKKKKVVSDVITNEPLPVQLTRVSYDDCLLAAQFKLKMNLGSLHYKLEKMNPIYHKSINANIEAVHALAKELFTKQ